MKKFFSAGIFLALVLSSCSALSPVRGRVFESRPEGVSKEMPQASADKNRQERPVQRFSDTIPALATAASSAKYIPEFEAAIQQFDNGKYDKACAKFQELVRKVNANDSLYYEIRFKLSECAAVNSKFEEASRILVDLTDNPALPDAILEKSLVWLGQMYCTMKKDPEALVTFTRLKKEFPRSQYLRVANCDAVKK